MVERCDCLIEGGRVIDPGNGIDGELDILISDGRIKGVVDCGTTACASDRIDARGCIVTPGMIDLHAHVYHKATGYSVDPALVARRSVVSTIVDAGSAGAGNFAGLRDYVIGPAPMRILAFINISFPGIFAFDSELSFGEASVADLLSPSKCARIIEENRDIAVGVKVRLGQNTSGDIGMLALERAIEAAEMCQTPLMTHIGKPPPSYSQILEKLRPGDILTHCFRPDPNGPVDERGRILAALCEARERGILFDIGHGMGAFGFDSAEQAVADGFPPDIISSDVHAFCIDGPAFDLLQTMAKLVLCGIELSDAIAMVTTAPARALRRDDLGHLSPGANADVSIFSISDRETTHRDVLGHTRTSPRRFEPVSVLVGGRKIG